jgi:hypothetical protein
MPKAPEPSDEPWLMGVAEACYHLGGLRPDGTRRPLARATLDKLIAAGEIQAFKLFPSKQARKLVVRQSVKDFIARRVAQQRAEIEPPADTEPGK